jgi:hypothetical protein
MEDPACAHRLAAAARLTCAAYEWPLVAGQWLAAYHLTMRSAAPGPELSRGSTQSLPDRVAAPAESLSPSEPA